MSKIKQNTNKSLFWWRHKRIIRNCRIQLDTCARSIQATWMSHFHFLKNFWKLLIESHCIKKGWIECRSHPSESDNPHLDIFGDILDNPGADSKIFADSTEGKKGYFHGIYGKKLKNLSKVTWIKVICQNRRVWKGFKNYFPIMREERSSLRAPFPQNFPQISSP